MSEDTIKSKYIYLPFQKVFALSVLSYLFISLLITKKSGVYGLEKEYWDFIIPSIYSCLVVLFFLRKNLALILDITWKKIIPLFTIMSILIGFTGRIGTSILTKMNSRLIDIESVNEIYNFPDDIFFKVKGFRTEAENQVGHRINSITGRYSDLVFETFFAIPFHSTEQNIWFGFYVTRWYGKMDEKSMKSERMVFDAMAEEKLNRDGLKMPIYFEKLSHSKEKRNYFKGIQHTFSDKKYEEQVILIPHHEPFKDRGKNDIWWLIGGILIGNAAMIILLNFVRIDYTQYNKLRKR